MQLRVLVRDKIRKIEDVALDGKIHNHISGREFTKDELETLKGKKVVKKETTTTNKK